MTSNKKKLLVTGASGFLGYNVCCAARSRWDVFGVYFMHDIRIEGVRTIRCDLRGKARIEQTFRELAPDAVVHCAAYPDPNKCEKDPQESFLVNVQASVTVAALAAKRGIPCVFTSTDLVFDGTEPPYDETAKPTPVNLYGQHKLEAEKKMKKAYPGVIICRMPLMFGDPGPCAKSFIQPMIAALREKKQVTLFSDEVRTPVSGMTAAKGLLCALDKGSGVLHLGGRQRISRYEFGLMLAEALHADPSLVVPALQSSVTMAARRPPDVSLTSEKAYGLGYSPAPLAQQLGELDCVRSGTK
jgi:dTDP-4-dehydrorhamnose reductase